MTPEHQAKVEQLAKEECRAHYMLEAMGLSNAACTVEEREEQAARRAVAEVKAREATAALNAAIQEAAYPQQEPK